MKKKAIILLCLMLLMAGMPACHSLPTQLPQNNIQISEEEVFNQKVENSFWGFITGLFRFFRGEKDEFSVKSGDVKEFSSTVKTYQEIEAKNNLDYENSHAKEKTDFGIGILDIIAGILSFFGL